MVRTSERLITGTRGPQSKPRIAEALPGAATDLLPAAVADARREAGSLLAYAAGRDRTFLITHADEQLDAERLSTFREYVRQRAAGKPLQYITGSQESYGLEFAATTEASSPRPEIAP